MNYVDNHLIQAACDRLASNSIGSSAVSDIDFSGAQSTCDGTPDTMRQCSSSGARFRARRSGYAERRVPQGVLAQCVGRDAQGRLHNGGASAPSGSWCEEVLVSRQCSGTGDCGGGASPTSQFPRTSRGLYSSVERQANTEQRRPRSRVTSAARQCSAVGVFQGIPPGAASDGRPSGPSIASAVTTMCANTSR